MCVRGVRVCANVVFGVLRSLARVPFWGPS